MPNSTVVCDSRLPSRRQFVTTVASGGVLYGLAACTADGPPNQNDRSDLTDPLYYMSASRLVQALRNKAVSSEELTRTLLERIEGVNPRINAVVNLTADQAVEEAKKADAESSRGESRGPLHGLPITLKDSIDTAGVISTAGTKGRSKYVPGADATVAARLLAAGAILLGKTNTPEFTASYETTNLIFGQTSNPYDLSRSPGGSSGGATAVVACGGSPLDIGSDTGGSIRYPAHCCGIAGIKPTSGRVPRTGHALPFGGYMDSFTQLGPLARNVDDLVLTLPLLVGPDWRDPAIVPMPLGEPASVDLKQLRVALHTDNGVVTPTPEIMDTVLRAGRVLSDEGIEVEERRPQVTEETTDIIAGLWYAEGDITMRKLLDRAGTTEASLSLEDWGPPVSFTELSKLLDRWDRYRVEMTRFIEKYDVILAPACALPAPLQGDSVEASWEPNASYTQSYNLTGWPAAVVRCGTSPEDLPIGVQVIARPWREEVALAVAKKLEIELGGFQPPPL